MGKGNDNQELSVIYIVHIDYSFITQKREVDALLLKTVINESITVFKGHRFSAFRVC